MTENKIDGIMNSMDLSLSKLREIVKDREAWHAAVHAILKRHDLASQHQVHVNKRSI